MMSTTEVEIDFDPTSEREEGELEDSDVEEGTYIPLTRPEAFNPPSLVHMQIQDEQSDDPSPESSATDSDEEPRRRAKRTKVRPRRPQPQPQNNKREKYNVWYRALQEELLSEDMIGFDVSKKRRYGVESYDYTIKYRLEEELASGNAFTKNSNSNRDVTSNKRKHSDRSNVKLRLGKRINSNSHIEEKHAPKYLKDLMVNAEDPLDIVASDIADKLSEEKKELIHRIVGAIGSQKAMELFKETQKIEADGGMLVMNGTRRRTPGGVYFFLLKRDDEISQDVVSKLFAEEKKENTRRIKKIHNKSRQKAMEQLKQTLTDSELPSLVSRGETTAQSEHGSNPPPSPATDARECSSDTDAHSHTEADAHALTEEHSHARTQADAPAPSAPAAPSVSNDPRSIQEYEDDDFLDVMCNDDMDLF
ncbi:phosphorylated adapter RNA export protein [Bombyx mori]|uniref:Phosphorylated adapter RNA export protein n=2 Tax=Bombyx mori TaxID=7091 RepID=A0A8R2AKD7_BOMMO|nr:phosphorylated adapter RNA export protein isoform X1 [Bombyx mori]